MKDALDPRRFDALIHNDPCRSPRRQPDSNKIVPRPTNWQHMKINTRRVERRPRALSPNILFMTYSNNITTHNNRTPLLCYVKLCASFHSHPGVTVRKRHIWVKIGDFFCPVWPWPLTSDLDVLHGYHFCHCNHSWKFHDNTIMRT